MIATTRPFVAMIEGVHERMDQLESTASEELRSRFASLHEYMSLSWVAKLDELVQSLAQAFLPASP